MKSSAEVYIVGSILRMKQDMWQECGIEKYVKKRKILKKN
jgi:hypothetical protein